MKEREQNELTTKPVNPTLSEGGNVFMPEPGRQENSNNPQDQVRAAWDRELPIDNNTPMDTRSTRQMAIDNGISPGSSQTPEQVADYLNEIKRRLEERESSLSPEVYSVMGAMMASSDFVKYVPREELISTAMRIVESNAHRGRAGQIEENQDVLRMLGMTRETAENVQKDIVKLVKEIDSAEKVSDIWEKVESFLKYATEAKKVLEDKDKEKYNKLIEEINSLKDTEQIVILKEKIKQFSPDVEKYFQGESLSLDKPPESLEDLATLIMSSESEDWRTGKEHQLIDENGKVVKENFIAWVRKRMVELHEFNPTSAVNFFSDINVKRGYINISFYEMIFTGSYFLEKKQEKILQKQEDGSFKEKIVTRFEKNQDYEDLKQQLIAEAFLFSNSRNNNVTYLAQMFDERELPKLLMQMYYANPFTRGKFLEQILSMPSMDSKKIKQIREKTGEKEDFESKKIKLISENNSDAGEGVRRALLAYYYINDEKMLKKILGEDSVFFNEEYLEYDSATGKVKLGKDGNKITKKGDANEEFLKDRSKKAIVYENGKVKNMKEFLAYVNVFNDAHKDERIVNEVRERIRQVMVDKLGINYAEAKYAEAWAYSMTRWMGIGARNDINAIGFDAWSKTQNFMRYRLKQAEEKRRGVIGNVYNLLGIRRASLSFMEGVTDVHGRTVIEAIQGGQGDEWKEKNPFKEPFKKLEDKDSIKHLEFKQDTAQRFAANHVGSSFRIYDFLINHMEFDLENMVTHDSFGRVIIDQKKANEMVDGIQKAIRYAYCTWGGTDYSKNIRVYEKEGEDGKEINAKNMPVAAALFGEAILRFINEDMDRKGIERDKNKTPNVWTIGDGNNKFDMDFSRIQSQDGTEREIIWKHILKYLMAEEIKSHRSIKSQLSRFDYATTEKIYSFLKQKGIITQEDIKDMRKLSKTSQRRMFSEEFAYGVGVGGAEGIWKAFKIMFKEITSGK